MDQRHVAGCSGKDYGIGIVVGGRTFIPNYGYTILEYKEKGGVNKLIIL